jgi:hypothetical protein
MELRVCGRWKLALKGPNPILLEIAKAVKRKRQSDKYLYLRKRLITTDLFLRAITIVSASIKIPPKPRYP